MSRKSAQRHASLPISGPGWHALVQIDIERIGLGPHGSQIFSELMAAARSGLPVSTIILAATLADVALYEGASYHGEDADMMGMGLDWLSAGERRRLDWLRGRRNGIVHHEGPVDGLMDQDGDAQLLAADADRALSALAPLLEGLERF